MTLRTWCLVASLFPSLFLFANGFPTAENLKSRGHSSAYFSEINSYRNLGDTVKNEIDKRLLVDPLAGSIDVSGIHEFQPPNYDAGDQRGPCPGLNALANHGYIPRDGVVSLIDVVVAMNRVFGMGVDLATALAVMGTVWVGNPLSLNPGFSIGGPTPKSSSVFGNLVGLLGAPQGIKYSHNFIESDSSPTRNDLYSTGNAWTMNISLFENLYNRSDTVTGVLAFEAIAEFARDRFHQAVAENPNFYYGPFTGMIARNAGYLFIARIFPNHSTSHLGGELTKKILKSFFAVTETEDGSLSYNEGWERIPENWYKTPVDYGLVQLNLDTVALVSLHPELASIGGNTGTTDSFTGVDISNITGGVLNAQTLLSGNNLLCLAFEVIKMGSPDGLSTIYKTLAVPLQMITDALAAPILDLACPAFADIQLGGSDIFKGLAQLYPGANRASGAF